jgi:hypothetical protein
MMGTLIRCIDCNKVINMTEEDFSPHYTWHEGEIEEQEGNDRQTFLQQHKGHKTEQLIPLTSPISDKPYAEPLKIAYFEATNGKRRFLIKRWRSTIDDPLIYEIIEGSIVVTNGKVRAQTEAIEQQLKAEHNSFISGAKLNCFINAILTEVEKLDPDTLEVSAEGETPLLSYYQLGSACVERIMKRCQSTFDRHELNLLRDFIIEHNEYDDVMTVVAEKKFTIKTRPQDQKAQTPLRSAHRTSIAIP